jgi:hypothetical protein
MSSSFSPRIDIRDETEEGAYVVSVDGERAGKAEYLVREGRHVFVHTEVDDGHAGSGLAAQLIRFALDDVRSRGGLVVPICPYVSAYIKRHPEYEDLVDHQMTMRLKARKR